jgi:peroxiredoxin
MKTSWRIRLTGVLVLGASLGPVGAQHCRYPYAPARPGGGPATVPRVGPPAPPVQFQQLDGTIHTLESYRVQRNLSKVVVLHFTTPGEKECEEAAPLLESLWRDLDKKECLVIAVIPSTTRDPLIAAYEFRARHHLSFPVVIDVDGKAVAAYAVARYPTTFVIQPGGRIGFIQSGNFDGGAVDHVVRRFRRWS